MRRGWPPFYRWRSGNVPWYVPMIPYYLGQTAILRTNSSVNTYSTDVGEAVGDHRPNFGLIRAREESATSWGRPPPTGAKLAHLRWVTSFGLLEWAYVVLSLRRSDLIWDCPCSPLFQALILLVSGPSPLGLMAGVLHLVLLRLFECIFYVFQECPPPNG